MTGTDRSMQKIAALAAVGMVVLALGIAGGSATYAYLSDGETLGTANDPNVIAAGNIASGTVTPGVGNVGTTTAATTETETETDITTETEDGTGPPVDADSAARTDTNTETAPVTETETDVETTTQTETEPEEGTDTDTETTTQTEPETETKTGTDGDRSCTGNTGVGNAGDDCTTASGLAVFGVPVLAAVRREYALPASSSGH